MPQTTPQTCELVHRGFRLLGEPVFRLSEGTRAPSMVVQLDSQDAVLPLKSVAREFNIDPESVDGQMLKLIEQALDFVVCLRLGDKFPPELNGGEASWEPTDQDRRAAASRVRHNLVRCVFARLGKNVTIKGGGTPGWEEDAGNRALLQGAIAGAATLIEGVDEAEVNARVSSLNDEMAYIESMRRTLLKGITGPREKLLRVDLAHVPGDRKDTVKQVQALARKGLAEITSRFDVVDVRLDDLLAMLRDMQSAVTWMRRQRDWLVRTNHAWGPVFADWANAPSGFDDFLWKVIERTYLFLAPRFMSVQEWLSKDTKPKKEEMKITVW